MYELESTHWWFRSLHELVLGYLDKSRKKNINILDAGCGTGRLMFQMKSLGEITGFDFRDTALSYCRKRGLKNAILVDLNKWNVTENNSIMSFHWMLYQIKE